ncbi:hypothetical protein HBB16_12660 [Pseudonocardia sp. MCCB 268]|nr:hypothetical protein [Pseudonocardia cytotoxica]
MIVLSPHRHRVLCWHGLKESKARIAQQQQGDRAGDPGDAVGAAEAGRRPAAGPARAGGIGLVAACDVAVC